jgi:TMEM189-like protein
MPRPRYAALLEAGALVLFLSLTCVSVHRLAVSLEFSPDLAWCALTFALGWLAADFASGVVHWFADTFFEETTPGIGPLLIQPFREHHRDPLAMTRHGFLELTGNSCMVLLPVAGIAVALPLQAPAQAALLAFTLGLFATNLFHKWAHEPAPPAVVRWLQARWLILPPTHHRRHHSSAHDAAYCVTTGWANRIAEACGAFAALHRILVWLRFPVARQTP